ncbi:MAG: hypothetical protein ACK53A_08075 [Gemmatimonadota bacterium]|jgi:hypothetical protein
MTEPSSTEPPSPRPGFLATLVRVLLVQAIALGALALLQYRYGR